ncbi:MAG: trehalose-phosphatase [Massilia sp.]
MAENAPAHSPAPLHSPAPTSDQAPDFLLAEDDALFLDLDGTLLDLAPTPDAVSVAPGLVAVLGALRDRLGGRLAIVSGRPLAQIDAVLAPLRLAAAGVHGLQRRGADGVLWQATAPDLAPLRARAFDLCAFHPLLWVEEKYGALALHYRQAPDLGPLCLAALEEAARACDGLQVLAGKMIVEVKLAGVDKGTAIRDFLTEAPFAGHRPVFAGDDTTDEAGFAWVQGAGGVAIKVGEGASAARHRIASAPALRAALEHYVQHFDNGT